MMGLVIRTSSDRTSASGAVLFAAARTSIGSPAPSSAAAGASFPLDGDGALKDIIDAPDSADFSTRWTRHRRGSTRRPQATRPARRRARGLPGLLRRHALCRIGSLRAHITRPTCALWPNDLATSRPQFRSSPAAMTFSCRRATAGTWTPACPTGKLDIFETGHFTWRKAPMTTSSLAQAWIDAHPAPGSTG